MYKYTYCTASATYVAQGYIKLSVLSTTDSGYSCKCTKVYVNVHTYSVIILSSIMVRRPAVVRVWDQIRMPMRRSVSTTQLDGVHNPPDIHIALNLPKIISYRMVEYVETANVIECATHIAPYISCTAL